LGTVTVLGDPVGSVVVVLPPFAGGIVVGTDPGTTAFVGVGIDVVDVVGADGDVLVVVDPAASAAAAAAAAASAAAAAAAAEGESGLTHPAAAVVGPV
jgi:hypothetical protein